MGVHGALFHVDIVPPDLVEKLFAGKNPSRVLHEMTQQVKLGRAEMHFLTAARDAVAGEVHFDITGA